MNGIFGNSSLTNKNVITFKKDTAGNWYALPISMVSEFDSMDMNEIEDQTDELRHKFFNFQITSPSQYVAEMLGETEDE